MQTFELDPTTPTLHPEVQRRHETLPEETYRGFGEGVLGVEKATENTADSAARIAAESLDTIEQRFPELGLATGLEVVAIGDATLPIASFTEKPLPPEAFIKITNAYEYFVHAVGEDNAARMGVSLAIVEGSTVDHSRAVGQADTDSGVIRIAADIFERSLLSEKSDLDNRKMLGATVDTPTATLVHEFGHIIDSVATRDSTEVDPRVVKEYFSDLEGQSIFNPAYRKESVALGDMPVATYQQGTYTQEAADSVYGHDASVEAPSSYARKSPGEYFAESFMGYAMNGEISEPLKDMVKSTIDTRLHVYPRKQGPITKPIVRSLL